MRRRRRFALAQSPTEVAVDLLLQLGVEERLQLFQLLIKDFYTIKDTTSFDKMIYNKIFDEYFTDDEEMLNVIFDEYDEPTNFGQTIARELYEFMTAMLQDLLMYDRKELISRL